MIPPWRGVFHFSAKFITTSPAAIDPPCCPVPALSVAFCRCGDRPWWMTMTSRVIGSSMPSVGEAGGSTCSRRHQHSSAGHATPLLPREHQTSSGPARVRPRRTNTAPWNTGKSKRIAAASSREAGAQHRSWGTWSRTHQESKATGALHKRGKCLLICLIMRIFLPHSLLSGLL